MVSEQALEQIVRDVLRSMGAAGAPVAKAAAGKINPARDYPLATRRPDLVRTPTGKSLADITLDKVLAGEVTTEDLKITPEVLELQAQVAEQAGRSQLARNLRRAAELTRIPDQRILEIYNALRPYRSTKAELEAVAGDLETRYGARINAAFIREAAEVHGRRGRLKEG